MKTFSVLLIVNYKLCHRDMGHYEFRDYFFLNGESWELPGGSVVKTPGS